MSLRAADVTTALNSDASPPPKARWWGTSRTWLLCLLHAALFVSVHPPLSLWALVFLIPVPLILASTQALSFRSVLLPLLVTQFVMWVWLLRWISDVTAVGHPALALYLSLHIVLLAWVLRTSICSPALKRMPRSLLVPMIWTALEFFRGEIAFNGYPWYMIGQPLIEWAAFAQSADLFGVYFVTFLAAIPAGLAIDMFPPGQNSSFRRVAITGVAILVLAANVAYGRMRLSQDLPGQDPTRVLAIQTNLPQSNKIFWSAEQQARDVPEFIALTERALEASAERGKVDLLVWPETMVPSLGFERQTLSFLSRFGESARHLHIWAQTVEQRALQQWNVPMLAGSNAWIDVSLDEATGELQRDREYNSVYLLQASPPFQRYDKAVLTPFGETMPYISQWEWLERQLLALGARGMQFNLDASPLVRVLEVAADDGDRSFVVGTPICFEDTVASLCRQMAYVHGQKRVDVLVNLSNEGWLGDSVADRILHAGIARFRCIENRIPMVRCANTGITMHVDSCGRVVQRIAETNAASTNVAGWLLAEVRFDERSTVFGRIGHLWPSACIFATLACLTWTWIARRMTMAPENQK